jgi:hypothetical protein
MTMSNANDEPRFCWTCEKCRDALFYLIIEADAADDEARVAELKANYDSPCTHLAPAE